MYRLKVMVNKRNWKIGINLYDTYLDAQIRQEELRLIGIKSIIIDKNGSKIIER